jgi:1-acyl-sn-glycerol-3-phosphate acyltransferase
MKATGSHNNAYSPPRISSWLFRGFSLYAARHVRRHFHSIRVSRSGFMPAGLKGPLVIYSNHASWWDPLTCILIADAWFRDRESFAPIDAAALEKYRFFRKLGFFPVEQGTRRGAIQFLRTSAAILQSPHHILWMTPQGRFADARERPVQFRHGIGSLAAAAGHAVFLPLAVEYVYWQERLPEILFRFGTPVRPECGPGTGPHSGDLTRQLEDELRETQDQLAVEALRRNPAEFERLLQGRAGAGGVYDLWRNIQARLGGRAFSPEHGSL